MHLTESVIQKLQKTFIFTDMSVMPCRATAFSDTILAFKISNKAFSMSKQFGAIYLILGTCIAAGMLGLPVVTSTNHFALTVIMIISAWLLMTTGAYCLLQVNLAMKPGANIISMSGLTLGKIVKAITWVIYLLLLYSLICAYLAASGDLFQALLREIHIDISRTLSTFLATIILGSIVYRGIRSVDLVNRGLMSTKIIICFILIGAIIPFSHFSPLGTGHWQWKGSTWLVIITSFGYGSILPSIRDYLHSDRRQLTRAVLIGGFVPMTLYIIWIAVIQGALPHKGPQGLIAMNNAADTNSALMFQIASLTHFKMIKAISVAFISICSITGFLSVSLSLFDVLADGLKRKKEGINKVMIAALALMPPLFIVIIDPAIFTSALAYAGFCCLYILAVLPIAMFLKMRYCPK